MVIMGNMDVLSITAATNTTQLTRTDDYAVFASSSQGDHRLDVVALFRLSGQGTVQVSLTSLGFSGTVNVKDLWSGKEGTMTDTLQAPLAECHEKGQSGPCAALFKIIG